MPVKLFHGTKIGQFTALEQVQVVDWCRSKPNMPLHSHPTLTCLNLPCQQPRRRSCWHPCTILAVSLLRRVNLRKGQQWSNITLKHLDLNSQPPCRLAASNKGEGEKEIQGMLQTGVICPSTSPWSSPVVLVKERDFCKTNTATRHDTYPLPRIDDTLGSLVHAVLFTTLDLASGYWQV